MHRARGNPCGKAGLKLLSVWADHLTRLLVGMSFALMDWFVLTGSSLLPARAVSHGVFLASFSFPHSFYVSLAEWVCLVLVCFLNLKVKFQGEELKSTEPAQELISC